MYFRQSSSVLAPCRPSRLLDKPKFTDPIIIFKKVQNQSFRGVYQELAEDRLADCIFVDRSDLGLLHYWSMLGPRAVDV